MVDQPNSEREGTECLTRAVSYNNSPTRLCGWMGHSLFQDNETNLPKEPWDGVIRCHPSIRGEPLCTGEGQYEMAFGDEALGIKDTTGEEALCLPSIFWKVLKVGRGKPQFAVGVLKCGKPRLKLLSGWNKEKWVMSLICLDESNITDIENIQGK